MKARKESDWSADNDYGIVPIGEKHTKDEETNHAHMSTLSMRTNINSVRPRVNTVNSNVNTVRSRQQVPTNTSNNFSPKRPQGNWGSVVKTSTGYNWRNTRPNSNCNGGPTFIRTVITKGPQGRPKPIQAWMPDENQILLKVHRHHNMYSFDMKTPTPAKGFACLIAKATSDESKMNSMDLQMLPLVLVAGKLTFAV
ncbi:hypothetical protein Tco_0620178 [Tanacetum coccineum]